MRSMYYKTDDGKWILRTWPDQCPKDMILIGKCQGASGHKGDHWAYKPDGTYCCSPNRKCGKGVPPFLCVRTPGHEEVCSTDSLPSDQGTSWIPPGHRDWVSPEKKAPEYHVRFWDDAEVDDAVLIAQLEAGDYSNIDDDACVDEPATQEEIDLVQDRLDKYK